MERRSAAERPIAGLRAGLAEERREERQNARRGVLLFLTRHLRESFSARIASLHPSFDAISAMNEGGMAIV
jgi:metal-responsive CopG/Arc/MetJ family transcriptional regulator